MRRLLAVLPVLLLVGGCAAFKELKPEPPLSPAERGYVELKNDKEDFALEKDTKYFIRFPAPASPNFTLVLVTGGKPMLRTILTDRFEDEKIPGAPIADETAAHDSMLAYAVGNSTPVYFWILDSVAADLHLHLRYRYVPRWRWTFENRAADLRTLLKDNTVGRDMYQTLGPQTDLSRVNLTSERGMVETHLAQVRSVNAELEQLAAVFPPAIAASGDTAYRDYVALKQRTEDEMAFQQNYGAVLAFLAQEQSTRGKPDAFLEAAPAFTEFLGQRSRHPAGVQDLALGLIAGRLPELASFLDGLIRAKRDLAAIHPVPPAQVVEPLYRACGRPYPSAVQSAILFIGRFNEETATLEAFGARERALDARRAALPARASEADYRSIADSARSLRTSLPELRTRLIEEYAGTFCATTLAREVESGAERMDELAALYQSAAATAGGIATGMWERAEASLRELSVGRATPSAADIAAERPLLVRRLEEELFTAVRTASEQRINTFIAAHQMEIDNVPALYADSAFLPVYTLTFSADGQTVVMRRRQQIGSFLEQIKYNQLPESSIRAIYAEFTRNMRERGVEKARAIVEHGKFYRGTDKQIRGLITECDVNAAKWIIRPREYRKLFALPVTSNPSGTNTYMFRVRLEIPTEAQFPVFDVNLKLPQEVAEKAGQTQWFESITIDKTPIRNEGRFRVTSPTAENNYEVLITPVQMDRNGRHVLEVRFSYPGFRVFEVSAMAQVPIIRKN